MGFPRQEYWSELPLPSPGDLPDPGIKPGSPALQADSLPTELSGKPLQFIESALKYGFPHWLSGKESARDAGDTGDTGSNPGWGRSPGEGHGNLL